MDWKLIPQRLLDELGVQSVICGGAARDTILGGQIRDIDLYLPHENFAAARNLLTGKAIDPWDDLCSDFPVSRSTVHQRGDEEYDHQYIWVQEEIECALPHPVNLIGVHRDAYSTISGENITRLFNLTTSQAWFTMDGEAVSSAAFQTSLSEKTCRITREDWGQEGTKRCALKFLDKYRYWWLDVPDIGVVPYNQAEPALDAWITGSML